MPANLVIYDMCMNRANMAQIEALITMNDSAFWFNHWHFAAAWSWHTTILVNKH